MADKSKVGKEYAPIVWEVERGKIREMANAVGDPNPIYVDREEAIKQGYRDCPAPPTFLTVPMFWTASMPMLINDLRINFFMVLHGGEEYEYYRDVYPGDVVTGVPRVVSVEEKVGRSGIRMDRVIVEILWTNQDGAQVARSRTIMLERR